MDSMYELQVKQIKQIEAAIKGAITQIEKSDIEKSLKEGYIADLQEVAFEIHHLAPSEKRAHGPTIEDIAELSYGAIAMSTMELEDENNG